MNIKTISATYERKFNLGDYNSLNVGATAWADLDETENAQQVHQQLFDHVKDQVRETALPVVKKAAAGIAASLLDEMEKQLAYYKHIAEKLTHETVLPDPKPGDGDATAYVESIDRDFDGFSADLGARPEITTPVTPVPAPATTSQKERNRELEKLLTNSSVS
jgi:hypothetical protein